MDKETKKSSNMDKETFRIDKETVVLILVLLLLAVSSVQAVQLVNVSSALDSGSVVFGSSGTSQAVATGTSAPTGAAALPTQVGGC